MEEMRFKGQVQGLEMDRVMRDQEFSMAVRHFHDTYELYYLLEGERYYFIDQETYLVKAGDVVLIRPNQIHKTSAAGTPRHERILLQIEAGVVEPFLKVCRAGTMEELFHLSAAVIKTGEEEGRQIRNLMEQLERELSVRQEFQSGMAGLLAAQLVLLLLRSQQKTSWYQEPETVRTWKHQKVHEVARYLMKYPETRESLSQLAARFYVSKSYLSRIFKEVTSFTVNEYKNISRIKKSQELLTGSRYSVTEIAEILGYETVTYYERVFKRYTGMTPLRYRKKGEGAAGA